MKSSQVETQKQHLLSDSRNGATQSSSTAHLSMLRNMHADFCVPFYTLGEKCELSQRGSNGAQEIADTEDDTSAAKSQHKMRIIIGVFAEPNRDSELRELWERNNDMLISWILNTILLMQPLPTAAKAYTMVRQEEKQKEGIAPKSATTNILNSYSNNYKFNVGNDSNSQRNTVLNTQNSRFTPQRSAQGGYERRSSFRKGVYCRNYGKEGHLQEECYKIVGYPVGHPLYGKDGPASKPDQPSHPITAVPTEYST
ncbi:hypothetical protein Tco_0884468, partial [Tanacetum coccineum]